MTAVLVVDDSLVDRRRAGALLERSGDWQLRFAENGAEALAQVREQAPDVVVTDLQMPELDGLGLVRTLAREFPLLPVILMTGQGSETIAVEALEAGAASYVPKRELDLLPETVERVQTIAGERKQRAHLRRCLKSMKAEYELGNEPGMLTSLVAELQAHLQEMGLFSEGDRLRVGVALEEALLNAAYHGNLEVDSELREHDFALYYETARQRTKAFPYRDRRVFVNVELSADGATYRIRDQGRGFDPRSLPDPTDPRNLERSSGRGLLLMRTFMDKVEYNSTGNEVTLVKRMRRTDTADRPLAGSMLTGSIAGATA
ncbi:MAG TPA: response regulator [Caulifigura sp.]|jgi:CheY-like chemotaxis protein|nr:response regulator [Caulifigura sp.]